MVKFMLQKSLLLGIIIININVKFAITIESTVQELLNKH